MKPQLNASKFVMILAFGVAILSFSAFRQPATSRQKSFRKDYSRGDEDTTTRRKRNRYENAYNSNQLDEKMKMLDKQMEYLEVQLKKIDFSKMTEEINEQLKNVQVDKIDKTINEALAKVDFEQLKNQLKDVRIPKEDMEQLKKDMEQLKIDLKNQKFDINIDKEKIKREVQVEMKKAKEQIQKAQGEMVKAKAEMADTKTLVDKLATDGMIDTKKTYTIEIKDGELFINGTKQSKEVNEKYKDFLKKKNLLINNEDGARKDEI